MLGLRFVRGLSLVAASGGHSSSLCGDRSSSRCTGLSPSRPLPLRGTGSRRAGSAAVAHALWHVGSSQTRARTRVSRISRQILNHCATREAQSKTLNTQFFFFSSSEVPYLHQTSKLTLLLPPYSSQAFHPVFSIFNPYCVCFLKAPNWHKNIKYVGEKSKNVDLLECVCT